MADVMTNAAEQTDKLFGQSREWLLLWSLERNGGIDEAWLAASGLSRREAEALQAANAEIMEEIRSLHALSRLYTLEMLFELLQQRVTKMLATVTKPAELRSLLGTLRQLPGAREFLAGFSLAIQPGPEKEPPPGLPGRMAAVTCKATPLLMDDKLPRQQRRALERQLNKLQKQSS